MRAEEEIKAYRLRPHRAVELAFQEIRADGVSREQDRALRKIEKNYARLMRLCDKLIGEQHALNEEMAKMVEQERSP